MSLKISRVDTSRCLIGEGPVWDASAQALYFLDIAQKRVHRFDPREGVTRSWYTPAPVGAMALREAGGAVLAMGDSICSIDFDSGSVGPIAKGHAQHPQATFNDGKVDKRGRFIIGSCCTDLLSPQPVGGVFSLGPGHEIACLQREICFSNSPCFSPDGRIFYFSDSALYACYAYDYDNDSGTLSNKRLFADTRALGGMPDGATVDSDGLVWMAIFRGGKVVAFRPDGRIERVVEMPVRLPGSTMFGGARLDQLFVPTIDPAFFNEPAEEGAGYLYVIEGLGARGLPEPRYAG
ncbi:MAG: SMP-30/gluconolactonase/LRE family protein [Steroidobacteraceae bacterium]